VEAKALSFFKGEIEGILIIFESIEVEAHND